MILFTRVSKRYAHGNEALSQVSFHIEKGGFLFVSGPSGAGKTTLVKLILAMEKPSEGSVIVAGRNVSALASQAVPYLRRNVGVIFQDYKLIQNRSVFANVSLALEILGWRSGEIRKRTGQILERLGIEHLAKHFPQEISGGEQQRVAIARALANNPPILVADEPTGSIDPALAREIMDLLVDTHKKGTTVLVATHDKGLMKRYDLPRLHLVKGRMSSPGKGGEDVPD
jgi:cell division transport system ATP-binding protein